MKTWKLAAYLAIVVLLFAVVPWMLDQPNTLINVLGVALSVVSVLSAHAVYVVKGQACES